MKKKIYSCWKLTLSVRFRHFLTTHLKVSESQIKNIFFLNWFLSKNLLQVDPWLKNYTTEVTPIMAQSIQFFFHVQKLIFMSMFLQDPSPFCHSLSVQPKRTVLRKLTNSVPADMYNFPRHWKFLIWTQPSSMQFKPNRTSSSICWKKPSNPAQLNSGKKW